MSRIRWTRTCMRPLVRKWGPAQSTSCLATWNSRSVDYLMAKVAAPAPAITCTFQSVRRKESGDKGMLSSCKNAFQKCQTSFLLPSCWLELRHISSTPGSVERWKIQSFFFFPLGNPMPGYKMEFLLLHKKEEWMLLKTASSVWHTAPIPFLSRHIFLCYTLNDL